MERYLLVGGFARLFLFAACMLMSKIYHWRKDALIAMRDRLRQMLCNKEACRFNPCCADETITNKISSFSRRS
jgi:hypothetical protein